MKLRYALLTLLLTACGDDTQPDVADDGGSDGPAATDPLLSFDELALPSGYDSVTAMAFVPGRDEFVLLGKAGDVWHFGLEGDTVTELGTFRVDGTFDESDCGLISIAFDPGFDNNGFIYLGRCISQTDSVIERYVWDSTDPQSTPATGVEIIRLGDPAAEDPWHNVGSMGFDDDGVLWALFGEKKVSENAQDTTNNLGALIRIQPSQDPGGSGYTPVADKPFADSDVYAYGLRSPWTGVLDARGFYWVGDVGADDFEEVDLVTEAGQNFGWDQHEGICEGGCNDLTDPLIAIQHGVDKYVAEDPDALPSQGRVVFVGPNYRDNPNDPYGGELTGRTIVGDVCTGFVRLLEVDDAGTLTLDRHLGHVPHAHAWTQGNDGFVYAVRNGGCGAGTIGDATATLLRIRVEPVE